jgi:FixJ family two-component response regulator/DNA-binding winged helix-turn-helix (wHTH) protein/tetratricopeptide (TPR) repeat protein
MSDTDALIYVVDDDASVRKAVASLIRSAGLRAETFASAQEFLAGPRTEGPSCLVLDVQLPGLNGLDLQQELAKADIQIPTIFLTGHGDIPMTVRAIKAGALEFLTKPFDDEDLLHAIRQGIARYHTARQQRRNLALKAKMKEFPPFRLDTANECIWRHREDGEDERIRLTPKAFDVLRYLVEHAGRLVTPDELLEALWPNIYVNPEGLRRYIQEIRKTLGDQLDKPLFIETLPKRGYQFVAPVIEEGAAKPLDLPTETAKNIVGRGPALAELDRCLSKALRGQRQIVFVTGEAGIGKTTLVDEFQRRAAANAPSIRIARGQCVEGFGSKEAYYPMLEALSGVCHGPGGESIIPTLAEQAPTWLVQLPALVKREHRETLQREIQGATRERMLREVGEVLETITSESPLLLILEDLHWADPSTVDLISALARRRSPAKLMLIATYRPVDVILSEHPLKAVKRDLQVHQLSREIALEPLSEAEVAEYLAAESSGASLPDGLAGLLYQQSEGNPLFMVAALDHMTELGLIVREKGSWRFRAALKGIDLEVPESLRGMIEVQIERLSPEEQRVLEVASLESVGRSRFAVTSRAEVIGLDPAVFEDICETLSRRHRILRSAAPEKLADGAVSACYEFVHALYRDVCYRRIAPGRRAQMHRRIGQWAEAHFEPLNEAAPWLAGHFEQGGDWLRTIKYLQLAADTAGRRFEPRQAAEILEHALELVKKLPEAEQTAREIEILEKLAAIYAMLGEDARAIENYEALAARAAHDGMIDVEVRALIDMAWPSSWTSSQRSLEFLERALQLSSRQEDPLMRARTRARCFALRLWQRWNPQDVEEFHNAFAEIRNAGDRRILAEYLVDFGSIGWLTSQYREARQSLIESRVILSETVEENPYLNTTYLVGQCIVPPRNLLFLGEWGEALRELKGIIAMLDKNGAYHWGQAVRLYRAFVHLHAMDFAGALAICNSTLPLVRDPHPRPAPDHPIPYPTALRMCLFLTGSAEMGLGNYESALEHLLAARAEMDRAAALWSWWWRMHLESALAEVWLAKGDLAQARPQAEKFLATALATAEHTWQALAWELNARVAMAERDRTRAQDCIAKGLSAMEGFEVPLAAWRVRATAAELSQRVKSRESAKRHLALSRETIMKLANSLPPDEPLRQIFLSAPMISKILSDAETRRSRAKEA